MKKLLLLFTLLASVSMGTKAQQMQLVSPNDPHGHVTVLHKVSFSIQWYTLISSEGDMSGVLRSAYTAMDNSTAHLVIKELGSEKELIINPDYSISNVKKRTYDPKIYITGDITLDYEIQEALGYSLTGPGTYILKIPQINLPGFTIPASSYTFTIGDAAGPEVLWHIETYANCTEAMNEYWYCPVCDKYYSGCNHSAECERAYEDFRAEPLGHDWVVEDGHVHCSRCDERAENDINGLRLLALYEINAAKEGLVLTEEEETAINACIETIENASEDSDESFTIIENAKQEALAIIIPVAKETAIAVIEEAMHGATGDRVTGAVHPYIDIINSATTLTAINDAQNAALEALNEVMATYTNSITLYFKNCDASYQTTDSESGIYVTEAKADGYDCWVVDKYNPFRISVPAGYVVTKVKFNFLPSDYADSSRSIDICKSTAFSTTDNETWEQKDGALSYVNMIDFRATKMAYVSFVTITYHKHDLNHNEAVAGTCVATGKKEFWKCNDCGHIYSNNTYTREVTNEADLILPIDPHNHGDKLVKTDAVAATCVSEGNIEYWHCSACEHTYSDEACSKEVANEEDLILPIDPTNHAGGLKEVEYKNASVTEDGVYRHWHCDACNNDYANANGTADVTGMIMKARYDADALLVGSTTVDESYLFGSDATVTFDGDNLLLDINDEVHEYTLSTQEDLEIDFSHTFRITANADPNYRGMFYSTFYTSEGAYKVPESAMAYICADAAAGSDLGMLTLYELDSIIHRSEAVVLKIMDIEETNPTKEIILMPSFNKEAAAEYNLFEGTDEQITLGVNQYSLTQGDLDGGFFFVETRTAGANTAYITLESADAMTFALEVDETHGGVIDAIHGLTDAGVGIDEVEAYYDLNGRQLSSPRKGINIIRTKSGKTKKVMMK